MPQIEHLVPEPGSPGGELKSGASWRTELVALGAGRDLDLEQFDASRELFALVSAQSVAALDAHGRRIELRRGEPFDVRRASATSLAARGHATALLVEFDRAKTAVEMSALDLATRRLRESLPRGAHFVLVAELGPVRVRVSGEEEAFNLAAGEALSIVCTGHETEIDAVALDGRAVALSVRLVDR